VDQWSVEWEDPISGGHWYVGTIKRGVRNTGGNMATKTPKPTEEEILKDAPFSKKPLWTYYHVRWDFITDLCGSVPGDPELVEAWLKARQPKVRPPSARTIEEIQEEVFNTLPEQEEEMQQYSMLTFQRVNGQLCMRSNTVRAHMKDCARILSSLYVGKIEGVRAFSTRVVNGVYLDERKYWLPIMRPDGSPIDKPDGERDKPIHTRGPRGQPINAIKRLEYINPCMLEFDLKILAGCIGLKDLETLFSYAGIHGYAGERGDGEGKYTFKITPIEV